MRRFLLLALLLLPVVTSCGGDALALDPVAEAAAKTRDVSSARFVMSMKLKDPKEGNITMHGPGEIDDHGRVMHMKMTMPGRQLGLGDGEVELEMIAAGKYFYFRGGPFDEFLPAGKEWVRLTDDPSLTEIGQNDPGAMLEYLQATSEVEKTGEARVRGVKTTRYHARIQLSKVAERVSPEAKRQLDQAMSQPGFSGIKEIPLDVWVDDEGLVRRLTMDWDPEGGSLVFDMELFDFGADLDLEVPPASKTEPLDLGDAG